MLLFGSKDAAGFPLKCSKIHQPARLKLAMAAGGNIHGIQRPIPHLNHLGYCQSSEWTGEPAGHIQPLIPKI
jgi:hypothetical protein